MHNNLVTKSAHESPDPHRTLNAQGEMVVYMYLTNYSVWEDGYLQVERTLHVDFKGMVWYLENITECNSKVVELISDK